MSTDAPVTHHCQVRHCNAAAERLLVTREGPHKGTIFGRLCSCHGAYESLGLFDIAREILCDRNDRRHLDPHARYEGVPDRCSSCSAPLPGDHYAGPMCRACQSDERERAIAESVGRLAAVQEKALEKTLEKALEPAASRPDATEALTKALEMSLEKAVGPKPLGDVIREAMENVCAQLASRTLVFADTAAGSSGRIYVNNTLAESSGTPEGAFADPANRGAHEAPLAEKANLAEASAVRMVSNLRNICCGGNHGRFHCPTHDGALCLRRFDGPVWLPVASLCVEHMRALFADRAWLPPGWEAAILENPEDCPKCHRQTFHRGRCWSCTRLSSVPVAILDAIDRVLGFHVATATDAPTTDRETTMPTPAPADPTNTTPATTATPRHGVSPKVYASGSPNGSPNGSSLVGVLRNDANDAAWRLAGSQFVKLTRDPLAGALTRHLGPGDESLRARIAAFLETELGTALLASLLSAGLSALPQGLGPGDVTDRLARELRVRAMAGAGDVMADVLMGPLREVMAMYLRGVPETEPGRTEGPPGLPEGTNGLSSGDAALHVEARVVEPAKVSP